MKTTNIFTLLLIFCFLFGGCNPEIIELLPVEQQKENTPEKRKCNDIFPGIIRTITPPTKTTPGLFVLPVDSPESLPILESKSWKITPERPMINGSTREFVFLASPIQDPPISPIQLNFKDETCRIFKPTLENKRLLSLQFTPNKPSDCRGKPMARYIFTSKIKVPSDFRVEQVAVFASVGRPFPLKHKVELQDGFLRVELSIPCGNSPRPGPGPNSPEFSIAIGHPRSVPYFFSSRDRKPPRP